MTTCRTNQKQCIVENAAQLKEAIKNHEPAILVTGKLAEKIKPVVKLKSLSPVKLTLLITTAATAIGITGLMTGGASIAGGSALVTGFTACASKALVPTIAAHTGVGLGAVAALISVVGILGLAAFALIKDYNINMDVAGVHLTANK